ncbi:MAG: PQQ-like beta-propeller repeat protein [Pirellulales bacterium]|nr:PQQ-like beta-propeller repeat protein [Pirellulales bacterium]
MNSCANFHGPNVLFGSQDGNIYCLAAADGKLVWKYESGDQIRSFPTVADGHAFVAGCDGRLHVIDLERGEAVRHVPLDGPTGCTAAVAGPMAYVGTEGGTFLAIDWTKGEVAWTSQDSRRSTSFRSSAAVTPERVIVGARDKQLRALDPKTGNELWAFATQGQVDSSPVVAGNLALVGSGDGRIYAVDLQTGKEVWRYEVGGHVAASPAVAAGRLVIGTDAGDLYCFGTGKPATSSK